MSLTKKKSPNNLMLLILSFIISMKNKNSPHVTLFLKVIVYDSSSDELYVCSKLSDYLTKDDIINICKDIFSSYNLKISLCTKIV